MTKVIAYSLFGDPSDFEFGYYLRGCYLNSRMNTILYPDFHTIIYVTEDLISKYADFWRGLVIVNPNITIQEEDNKPPRCEGMLRRMMPIFGKDFDTVICRDLDSVSTYREANCVYAWIRSGLPYHAINDNAAHSGLMGGLVGYKSDDFKRDTGYNSFRQMINGLQLHKHGSDQDFMNKSIHPKIKHGLLMHNLKGAGCEAAVTETEVPKVGEVRVRTSHSDLISRYIGSAGVIDFELIRFFNSVDQNTEINYFEKEFKSICYWRQ